MDSPLTVGLSLVAVGVSIWSVLTTRRVGRAQARVQEHLLSLESGRERDRKLGASSAQLRAAVQRAANSAYLVIANEGASEARNIQVLLDGKNLPEHDHVLVKHNELATTLGPGGHARYIITLTFGTPSKFGIEISWDDDRGTRDSWRSDLRWL